MFSIKFANGTIEKRRQKIDKYHGSSVNSNFSFISKKTISIVERELINKFYLPRQSHPETRSSLSTKIKGILKSIVRQ